MRLSFKVTLRQAVGFLVVTLLFVIAMVLLQLVRYVETKQDVRVERETVTNLRESLRVATVYGVQYQTVTSTVTMTATSVITRQPSPAPTVTVTTTAPPAATPTVTVTTTPPDECDILPPNACPRAQGVTAAVALLPVVLVGCCVLFHRATKGEAP